MPSLFTPVCKDVVPLSVCLHSWSSVTGCCYYEGVTTLLSYLLKLKVCSDMETSFFLKVRAMLVKKNVSWADWRGSLWLTGGEHSLPLSSAKVEITPVNGFVWRIVLGIVSYEELQHISLTLKNLEHCDSSICPEVLFIMWKL